MSTRSHDRTARTIADGSWSEAFHELWRHAAQRRGVHGDSPTEATGDDAARRWPRTRGSDVLAIAAVVDPVVRAMAAQPDSLGIARRWDDCRRDLAELALDQVDREYAENRAFWATLIQILAYLAWIDAPVPGALWHELVIRLAGSGQLPDDAAEDVLHLAADSYDELWRVQRAALCDLRGTDVGASCTDGPGSLLDPLPRTTHHDAGQLAAFWSAAWGKAQRLLAGLDPEEVAALGLDGLRRRWQTACADVAAHARGGDPAAIYPGSRELWCAASALAVALAAIDDQPLRHDFVARRGAPAHRNARVFQLDEPTFRGVWTALRDQLARVRGADLRPSAAGVGDLVIEVPRTTHADALALAAYWQAASTRLGDAPRPEGDSRAALVADVRSHWRAVAEHVETVARTAPASAAYAHNEELWRASRAVAAMLDRVAARPERTHVTLDMPEDNLAERVLEFAKGLGGHIADAAGAVRRAAGAIGEGAGTGFLRGLGGPLLVGGGSFLVLWLLLRRGKRAEVV